MKQLLLIVIILSAFGVLHAQETSPVANKAALIANLETAAGFVIGGEIVNVLGLGIVVPSYPQPGIQGYWWTLAAYAVPFGSLIPTLSYIVFLETYNAAFPADKQIMLPYLLLTFGGIAAALPIESLGGYWVGEPGPPPSAEELQRVRVAEGLGAVGALSYAVGAIIAIVHTQELLATAKASGSAPVSQDRRQPADRTIVTPEIGIGYLGVAISMP